MSTSPLTQRGAGPTSARPALSSAVSVALLASFALLALGERPAHAAPTGFALARSAPNAVAPARRADTARAFCDYVSNVAASEGALLRAPWLFSSFGTASGTSVLDPDGTASPEVIDRDLSLRLQAGLGFSPTRYYLAGLLADQASAECERHRAEEEIRAFGANGGSVARAALEAKIRVLEQALPEAERLVRAGLDALEASRTTLQEQGALELRVDDLRRELAEAELELAALPETRATTSPRGSFERLRRWTAEKQAVAARLRRAGALSLTLRGGYDELFGVPQQLPLFGSVTLEFNPGWFWQSALDARAERAHAESVEAEVLGQKANLAALARRLEAELAIWKRRRAEVKTRLADSSQRRERLLAAGSAAAREYSEYVWFEEVRLRADEAFLDEQVRALTRLTGVGE
jgi:cell division septum initiation protein DivIVA